MSPTESSSQCESPQFTQRQHRCFLGSCAATPCSYLTRSWHRDNVTGREGHFWLCSSDTQACKIQHSRRKPEQHECSYRAKSRELCLSSPWQHSFTKIMLSWNTGKQSPHILVQSPRKLRFCVLVWGFILVPTTTLPINYLQREGCSRRNKVGKIQLIVWDISV